MAEQFSQSVESGLKLSKRIYYGKDRSAPKPEAMEKSSPFSDTFLPTAPVVYAVITEPAVVDNPDIPSYQPYVHGRCDPPALIPLHMLGIAMEAECYMDTAFVSVSGTWRVHCVVATATCDCRIAVPIGEQGSILGVWVDTMGRSYHTQLRAVDDTKDLEKLARARDGFLLKNRIYTLKVPQVQGGSVLSIKVSWSQKLSYQSGQFCLTVPFRFPAHVIPVGKGISKRERIMLNVDSGTGTQVLCHSTSHPLKEIRSEVTKLGFSYDAEVSMWSSNDFNFSYTVSSGDMYGGLLLQSPSLHDMDQRDMFCFYLFPGNNSNRKIFRKKVIFLVDISMSMQGSPLDNAKDALLSALSMLDPEDFFNIIAFNGNTLLFTSSMIEANKEAIESANQWIDANFVAEGGTNISQPLNQAIEMMAESGDSISLIFLITDGAVEDERDLCNLLKDHLADGRLNQPRICTFGIGTYCNHYFLQMLAQIGRGYYDAAYDVDSIDFRIQRLITKASSVILANIKIDALEHLDSLELYPYRFPDLLSGAPLIVSGRFKGNFPDCVKVSGILADSRNFVINLKAQKTKDFSLERVLARAQIDTVTACAWLLGNKDLEEKVVKISLRTGFHSEYTSLILVQTEKDKLASKPDLANEKTTSLDGQKIVLLWNLGVGFGSWVATAENLPPGSNEPKLHETADMIQKVASKFCSKLLDCCCCMCLIQFCSKLSDRCAVTFTQLCAGIAIFECMECCCDVCLSCD